MTIQKTLKAMKLFACALTIGALTAGASNLIGADTANARSASTGPETSNVIHTTFKHGAPRVSAGGPCKRGARITVLRITDQSAWRFVQAGVSPESDTPDQWQMKLDQARELAGMAGSMIGRKSAAKLTISLGAVTILPTYVWWLKYERDIMTTTYDIVCENGKWVVKPPVKVKKVQQDWVKLRLPGPGVLSVFGTTPVELANAKKRVDATLGAPAQTKPQIYHKVH